MKKRNAILTAAILCALISGGDALAVSPIPTFDKEAATVHPYMRTGQQETVTTAPGLVTEKWRPGNTGTAEAPAFYVRRIKLTGDAIPEGNGALKALLGKYTGRSVQPAELEQLRDELNEYCRLEGLPLAQAVIPAQEVTFGTLEIHMYVAKLDEVTVTKNESAVADSVIAGFARQMKPGETITDHRLDTVINNINDLPGVIARTVLRPGSRPGTTSADIEVLRRPTWNSYVFADNGGGYYSGRYRYGVNAEINNPGRQGDKFVVSGMISNKDTKNYGLRYETPVGYRGSRLGIAWSQSNYELHTNDLYDSLGESKGISLYGLTPLARDRMNRLTAIYGYDHRSIEDKIRFKTWHIADADFHMPDITTDKKADVFHVGLSGSQYYPNEFLQYDLIYWYGDMNWKSQGLRQDSHYHKLTGDLLKIWYDGRWNYRVNLSGQMASASLDGSEQFFLGGMNGVRAYGNGDGYGDIGYLASGEVRWQTNEPGLELAAFIDNGAVKEKGGDLDRLSGWGLGLRYEVNNDWYARLDWARKIDARRDLVEPKDHSGRIWFQIYRMF